ncbi:MAG: chemotaxis protein [Cellulosilyticaceae bacterium]
MSEILLQTGTGEVEIVEFLINNQNYAINVLKVKGIIQLSEVTPLPRFPKEVAGVTNVRGEMNTVIDLKQVLHNEQIKDYTKVLGLLCEFNESTVVFLVEEVKGIRRVRWEEIKQGGGTQKDTLIIGSILIDKTIIVLLDFESITMAANIGRGYERAHELISTENIIKKDTHIVLAEDSRAIGEIMRTALIEAGYNNIKLFPNGQEAKEYIFSLKKALGNKYKEKIELLITDIEMPILDGYTLTKYIKEDDILKDLPVIIFSSLINTELEHKGKSVGADIQISKPSMKQLVEVVTKITKEKRQLV